MGGCKCTFRKCTNASINGFHFFHYPTRDMRRCEQWIINARKPHFHCLPKEKLRNKVICQYHFEEKCFMNYKHDRLTPFAIPTIDPDGDDGNSINEIQVVPVCRKENPENQITSTDYMLVAPELNKINLTDINGDLKIPYETENKNVDSSTNEKDITLIPTSVDKTTFLLSEITELNTFSYTCNELSSNPLNFDNEIREVMSQKSVKKITAKVISNKLHSSVTQPKLQVISNTKLFSNTDTSNETDLIETDQKAQSLDHITSAGQEEKESVYSVSSTDGNLELVPVNKSTESDSDIYPLYLTNTSSNESKKSNGENPNKLVYSISINHENQDVILNQIFNVQENQTLNNDDPLNILNYTDSDRKYDTVDFESVQSFKLNPDIKLEDKQMHLNESISQRNEISVYEMNNECELSIKPYSHQKEYIKQIKKNAKQIANLKQLFFSYKQRQSRKISNKFVLSKKKIYRQLRRHINPTLSTIVQMELFNYKQQWTRKEKSMAIEMYSASPEGYSVLTNKWGWKMPPTDLVQKWMKED